MTRFKGALFATVVAAVVLPGVAQAQERPEGGRGRAERADNGGNRFGGDRSDRGNQPRFDRNDAPRADRPVQVQPADRQQGRFDGQRPDAGGGNFDRRDNGRGDGDRRDFDRRDGDRRDNANRFDGRRDNGRGPGQQFGRGNDNRFNGFNRNWRQDRRYDWQGWRNQNRSVFRGGRYIAPRGWSYGYRRFGIGNRIPSLFFGSSYWIADPWAYRLPPVDGPFRWVRYYGDVLLIDLRSGEVVDAIPDFFF